MATKDAVLCSSSALWTKAEYHELPGPSKSKKLKRKSYKY